MFFLFFLANLVSKTDGEHNEGGLKLDLRFKAGRGVTGLFRRGAVSQSQ